MYILVMFDLWCVFLNESEKGFQLKCATLHSIMKYVSNVNNISHEASRSAFGSILWHSRTQAWEFWLLEIWQLRLISSQPIIYAFVHLSDKVVQISAGIFWMLKCMSLLCGPAAAVLVISRLNQTPWFSTIPDLCPSCSPPQKRRVNKNKNKNCNSIAIYCKPVALHLHLVPLPNHAITVRMSNVDKCLVLGLKWLRSHL